MTHSVIVIRTVTGGGAPHELAGRAFGTRALQATFVLMITLHFKLNKSNHNNTANVVINLRYLANSSVTTVYYVPIKAKLISVPRISTQRTAGT